MTAPETPLSPETLDELLSAELDGELERAAGDLGLTLEEATAAMNGAPRTPQRRVELTQARDALAARVPLAPSTELQLVSAALRRSVSDLRDARNRPRRAWQALVSVGSAAAVIAVIALAATHLGGESSKSSSSAAAVAAPSQASPLTPLAPFKAAGSVSFGDVSRPAALRAQLAARLLPAAAAEPAPKSSRPAPNPTFATTGPKGAGGVSGILHGILHQKRLVGLAGPQGLQGDEGLIGPVGGVGPIGATGPTGPAGLTGAPAPGAPRLAGPQGVTGAPDEPVYSNLAYAPAQRAAAEPADDISSAAADGERACAAAAERRNDLASVPVLSGTGTYAGQSVVVSVFPRSQQYVAYVMTTSNCAVVLQETVP